MKKDKTTLVIFTYNPPTDAVSEASFLHVELEYLGKKFQRILIVPEKPGDDSQALEFPQFEIDMSLANALNKKYSRFRMYFLAASSTIFWSEIFGNLKKSSFTRIKTALWFYFEGYKFQKWFNDFVKRQNIDLNSTVFYTYWFDKSTFGMALAKETLPTARLISRAHGIDLYEDRKSPPYFPFRTFSLAALDGLYLISEDGLRHISKMYPDFFTKYKLSKLGVRGPRQVTNHSLPGMLQIVSCAFVRPEKRINLMLEGIRCYAMDHPEITVFWDHFGGGDPLQKIIESSRELPSNVVCKFWGNISNDIILEFYHRRPVDVFLNVSASEGIPVSIMESMSNGIPVVATAVGGVPEIVNDENGVLLNSDPRPAEIAAALNLFIPYSGVIAQKKENSRKFWELYFDADRNFEKFSCEIFDLLKNR
jgi:colanic acid/amylovoran biosynthesis glycosyltransferase